MIPRHSPSGAPAYSALESVNGADAARALACARLALEPMGRDELREMVATLAAVTARRPQSPESDALAAKAWIEYLGRYPADAVRSALSVERWVFWPALAEVLTICKDLSAERFAWLRALEALAAMSDAERGAIWRERALEAERDGERARAVGNERRAAECAAWAEKAAARARSFGVAVTLGNRSKAAEHMAELLKRLAEAEPGAGEARAARSLGETLKAMLPQEEAKP